MLNATFRPLDQWPGERTKWRKEATFRASYPQTLDLLEQELAKLHARAGTVVIQVEGMRLEDIRNDGWPRGSWNSSRPGVIVSFESPKGSISMPCDKFNDWKDNLRAIAKSLEALRMVDRYGVTRGNEQYRGWAKLGAPKNGRMTREQAMLCIALAVGADPVVLREHWDTVGEAMIKRAKKVNHPDLAHDDEGRKSAHEIFVTIGQAEEVLLWRSA
jgi:hypothetical protein